MQPGTCASTSRMTTVVTRTRHGYDVLLNTHRRPFILHSQPSLDHNDIGVDSCCLFTACQRRSTALPASTCSPQCTLQRGCTAKSMTPPCRQRVGRPRLRCLLTSWLLISLSRSLLWLDRSGGSILGAPLSQLTLNSMEHHYNSMRDWESTRTNTTSVPPTILCSRVEWNTTVVDGQYWKTPNCQSCLPVGSNCEDNWVRNIWCFRCDVLSCHPPLPFIAALLLCRCCSAAAGVEPSRQRRHASPREMGLPPGGWVGGCG
jgi:hypothetical protein